MKMTCRNPRGGSRSTSGALALAAALALTCSLPAEAQDQSDGSPLRFLKPWIERQLFGHVTSKPAEPAPGEGASFPTGDMGPTGDTGPTSDTGPTGNTGEAPDAAIDQPESPSSASDEPATTDTRSPAPDNEDAGGNAELRGADEPAEDAEAPDMSPNVPPVDDATGEPNAAPAGAPVEAAPEPLRFAVLAGRSVAATMAAVGPVADALQETLGRPVEILPLASYAAMIDAQVQRRVDGGFFSAAAFAAADSSCSCLQPLVAPEASDGTLAYHAVIVARAGSGIATVGDLAGKTVAITAADSLGGRHMQLAGLVAQGIDPAATFGGVIEVESPEAAVRLLAAGEADAAFAWSSLAGNVESGYSRGTLTALVSGGEIAMDSLVVIWSSPPIAHGPFAVLRTLGEDEKAKIESYLEALSAGNPDAYDMLDPFYGSGYAAVDSQDYAGLEALLAENVDAIRFSGGPATTGATDAAPGDTSAGAENPPIAN